jgi:hypothetical protein
MIKRLYLLSLALISSATLYSMTFDNRFLPLYFKPFTRKLNAQSFFRFQPFFMRSERGHGDFDETNLPNIDGTYDQVEIGKSLIALGRPNPFPSQLRGIPSIPWRREGHIDAEGIAFFYEQYLGCFFSVGTSFLFAHINSGQEFCLDSNAETGNRQQLFTVRERMDRELGITPPLFHRTMFGDFDFYLRFGTVTEYLFRVKRIDSGLKLGVIAPTAPDIAINNPASIPLGGEKHWGIYLGLENEVELKEDLIFGVQLRAIKRFARTLTRRMPIACEPTRYGAEVGPLRIDPGWTFVFNPYFSIEGLREGFGLRAQYTLVAHLEDTLTDMRSQARRDSVPVNLDPVRQRSSWGMEHVTLGAFYDFGKTRDNSWCLPIISVYWDIPVDWLVSKRSAKTHSVSVMFELNF